MLHSHWAPTSDDFYKLDVLCGACTDIQVHSRLSYSMKIFNIFQTHTQLPNLTHAMSLSGEPNDPVSITVILGLVRRGWLHSSLYLGQEF